MKLFTSGSQKENNNNGNNNTNKMDQSLPPKNILTHNKS